MRRFFKTGLSFLFLLLCPFVTLLMLYIHFDPFQVVKKYTTYQFSPVDLNRDYISTEVFLANRQKYNYNSFIFGSSRATSFNPDSWAKYLNEYAVPFTFDATAETVYGINTKLKFLEKEGTDLDNILILLCRNAYYVTENYNDHLGIKHPKVSGESTMNFQYSFFKAYFNLKFLMGYYSYLLLGRESILTHGIIQHKGLSLDYKTNDITPISWDNELQMNSKKYYEVRKEIFYNREGEQFENNQEINETCLDMLMEIRDILERNHSNYKIILSPIYDQIKFPTRDKEILVEIFGDHLFDFTGKNFITENYTNWYESFHFRPFVADSILNIIYKGNNDNKMWR